jgi:hypothetical protein
MVRCNALSDYSHSILTHEKTLIKSITCNSDCSLCNFRVGIGGVRQFSKTRNEV